MALRVHYTAAVGVDQTFETVRLGSINGLTTNANQGTVGGGQIEIPDKGGLITVRGLKRLYVVDDESPAGSTMLFDGYNGPRTLDRGEFLIGADRWWHCTLVDLNNLLTTFVIRDVAGTPGFNGRRPAETDVARVQWLLTTPYMQQVHDYGLVSVANAVNMDAADYTQQTAADVLRDCGLQAQKQWFVYYDESHTGDTNRGALFYDKAYSDVFNSTLSFSNVEGDWGNIDDPDTLCFQVMPSPSPGIEFDPSRVVAGLSMPFSGVGSPTYRTRPATATDFYWRDGVAPSANVKTLALANERADRMLEAVKDEAKVVTFRAKLPRAKAGLIMAGHRFLAHFEHLDDQLGGTQDFVAMRVLALTFAHDTEDHRYYNIGIRADPLPTAVTPFGVLYRPGCIDISAGQTAQIGWYCSGDDLVCQAENPPNTFQPIVGPLAYGTGSVAVNVGGPDTYTGFVFTGSGTIDFTSSYRVFTACSLQVCSVDVLINGSVVATADYTTTGGGDQEFTVNATGVAITAGDVLTAQFRNHVGSSCGIYIDGTGTMSPHGTQFNWFEINGGSLA